ncbi:hypothetical protein B9Z55_024093 [Caenorhabditis nigoni]|uniref:Uncharacterized protein n=1 Tax=Caenorhabditis nigoni TaxID=1611254 RepID=A0A2G5SSX9_9PELO|nr:hypothetical protein B9Z55_024093 [Caenorhabditis nigoni]
MFVVVDNTMPTWTVLVLVILALFWGVIVALYIADVSWVICFAKQAVNAKRQSEEQRRHAATSRQSVFVVGDQERNLEASRRLIREV